MLSNTLFIQLVKIGLFVRYQAWVKCKIGATALISNVLKNTSPTLAAMQTAKECQNFACLLSKWKQSNKLTFPVYYGCDWIFFTTAVKPE